MITPTYTPDWMVWAIGLTLCTLAAIITVRAGTFAVKAGKAVSNAPAFTGSNPYRIGAHVYVMETDNVSDMDWTGTVIGMNTGMVMVRDDDSRVVAHVNKDQVYAVKR